MMSPASPRSAFTLLELLLVLAILSALAAVAIPQFGLLLGDRRLVRAGEQVQIEMTRLRVDAMRQGRILMLQADLSTGTLQVRPYYSLADATEALDQTGSQSGLLTGADVANSAAMQPLGSEEATKTIELPEDITVESVATVSSARAFEVEQTATADQGSGLSAPVLFYPDGTSSTGAVTLVHPEMGKIIVKLRGITGEAMLTEVLPQ